MGNTAKDEALYQEMCRVVGKVVLEMRDLGQEPKHIVIAGVVRTALANPKIKRFRPGAGSDGESCPRAFWKLAAAEHYPRASGNHKANHRFHRNLAVVGNHRLIINRRHRIVQV